eukprot:UN04050
MGNAASGEEPPKEPQEVKPTGGYGPEVYLNVYKSTAGGMTAGAYHSGIEIGDVEYAFGGGSVSSSGVYTQTPREDPPGGQWTFYQTVPLGKSKLPDLKKAKQAIQDLGIKFKADSYNVVHQNCNHFTEAAAKVLGVYVNYPEWVNRLARAGAKVGYGGTYDGTKVEVEETKTVFETTKGHKLADDKQKVDVPIDPRTGKPNPWAVKKAPSTTSSQPKK